MSFFRLLLRNLLFHWRGNVPVLLGVLVGSAVLTGALLVGDSLRGSLRDRTLRRLGWVDQALVAPRFFRAALAQSLEQAGGRLSPALMLQATAGGGAGADRRYVRGVNVLGVEASFFAPAGPPKEFGTTDPSGKPRVLVSGALAQALGVKAGDAITLRLQKPSALPREAALGSKKVEIEEWELVIGRVLDGDEQGNLFNLRPELEAPRNVLVSLGPLQERLKLPNQANALLASADPSQLKQALQDNLALEDWGLTLHTPATRAEALFARINDRRTKRGKKLPIPGVVARAINPATPGKPTRKEIESYFLRTHPYLALQSKQLLLSEAVADAARDAAREKEVQLKAAPTLVYLCRLTAGGKRIAGVVAALPPDRPPPLGPFLPPGKRTLGEDDITLVDWGWQQGKRPEVRSKVVLTYKPAESPRARLLDGRERAGPAEDRHHPFRLAGYIPLRGVAADPYLTPEFPGITDKDDAGDWELPFDDPAWDRETVRREYTDRFWDEYRATPRAYIRLETGQELWRSRFGDLTSIRFAPEKLPATPADRAAPLNASAEKFRRALLARLTPEEGGFVFDEVKEEALKASRGGTPFDLLFLGFSCFLIASALLLVGLLFRLELDRRASQIGLLFAEGFSRSAVRRLLLGEGGLLALVGVVLGAIAALAYSRLLVDLLAALWPGGTLKSFLAPHYTWLSLALGAAGSLAVSLLTIAWVVRGLSKVPPRALLAGQTTGEGEPGLPSPSRWPTRILIASSALGVLLLPVGFFVPGQEAQAGTFFTSGMLFLTAGLAGLLAWMRRGAGAAVEGPGWWSVARLGVRNAARHPARSLLTVGLLASASFLLIAVESFRRTAEPGKGEITGPDGGFALMAESDLPLFRDLNSRGGRDELLSRLEFRLQNEQGLDAARTEEEVRKAEALLKETTVVAFRLRAGDDASCLNLYQPRAPRVLGVPRALIDRGGFVFDSTRASTPQEKANPWLVLERDEGDIPAFGEANTVKWMLPTRKGRMAVQDEKGEPTELLIAGLLHDSVFQSSLLVSEERFLQLYPSQEGYNFFLIAPPKGREDDVKQVLERALGDRGFEVTRTDERLAAYLAVENTYLTTFQALGGLGLLLGSLGLAVVLLRAVWERRAELALLRALGYRNRTLGWLVLAENSFLLLVGLVIGSASALLSILPQVISGAGSPPWGKLALLFAGVLLAALTAGTLAVAGALRAPIVPALRRE
jgi:ABC-type lipoprotein release transport system permease subunit